MTNLDHYQGQLSEQSRSDRETLESRLEKLYGELKEASGVARLKLLPRIDHLEQQLQMQGANPKELDFDELKEHLRSPIPAIDAVEAKYRARISSRATAIRAYCVWCQGSDTAEVRRCAMLTCPLHPFRMGLDPLRGWEMPVVEMPDLLENETDDGLFEDDDEGDTDAKE